MMQVVLASQSPRRKQLLELLNIDYLAVNHSFDENSVIKKSTPEEYCEIISKGKANSIKEAYNSTILAADTIVSVDNVVLEKPIDREEAYKMLNMLNNHRHEVLTGVTILDKKKGINFSFVEKTEVYFNKISDNEIYYYIDNYKPFDKSGAYGIQDFSSIFVRRLEGCYFNVVGLPISRLFFYLKKFNLVQFSLDTED